MVGANWRGGGGSLRTRRIEVRPPCTLPPLRGAAWWAFLAAWLATVALALYIAASFAPVFDASPPDSYLYGFALKRTALTGVSGDDAVVQFTLGSEAGATGLRAGDRVTAVNGIPIADAASFGAAMQRLWAPGTAYHIQVRRR